MPHASTATYHSDAARIRVYTFIQAIANLSMNSHLQAEALTAHPHPRAVYCSMLCQAAAEAAEVIGEIIQKGLDKPQGLLPYFAPGKLLQHHYHHCLLLLLLLLLLLVCSGGRGGSGGGQRG